MTGNSKSFKMDLIIVNPGSRAQVYGSLGPSFSGLEPPVWAGLTAAFVRERGYTVSIIDAEAENWNPADTAAKIAEGEPLLADIVVQGANPSASSTPK
ncbi:B12-binding domain-containing radical SAM protein, partial [Chloroflexota bacterium]